MHRFARRLVPVVAASALALGAVVVLAPSAAADTPAGNLSVTSMDNGATAAGLAQSLAGTGVTLSNVTYTGAANAAGTFTGGDGIVGFDSGIALSTGSVQSDAAHSDPCAKGIEGPNQCDSNTTQNGTPGDPDLDAMAGFQTFDASVLQFDFIPAGSSVTFKYVFGSDEYPEYANSVYNDTFAFFVNGQNCALAPGSNLPVSINTINGGNPLGTNARDPEYYVDNHYDASAGSPVNTEFDGMTTVLTCTAAVTPGQTNHMKLAIADGSDQQLDSTVLLQADSLVSPVDPTQISTVLSGGGQSGASLSVPAGTAVTDQATLSGRTASTAGGTVTYTVYSDAACSTSPVSAGTASVVNGVVGASNPVTLPAGNYYWQAGYSGDSTHATTASTCGDEVLTVTAAVNSPPTGSTGGPYTGAEGSPIYITASAADGDGDALTHTWSVAPQSGTDPGAACVITAPTSLATTVKCNDDGIFALKLTISDGVNAPVVLTTTLTVSNVAPAVVITTPANATTVDVGSTVNLSASFVDPGSNDTQTCTINWGDGVTTNGFVSGSNCIGSHAYPTAGTETVTVKVTDDDGGVGTASITLVAGSDVGKVTGGGFVGGCGGKTTFGFVVMSSATGSLHGEFEMNGRGHDRFHGSTVTGLSISTSWGTTTATWSGAGEWDGTSGYTFVVTVKDGGNGHGAKDTIALTVRSSSGHVVYSINDQLQGGNIVIH